MADRTGITAPLALPGRTVDAIVLETNTDDVTPEVLGYLSAMCRTETDAAEVFSAQAEAKNIELLSHCTADLPQSMVGDAARLRQILHNLVGNAVKFTERGEVVLTVRAEGDEQAGGGALLHFTVRDTGIGLNDASLARLFQKFSQADSSTTRKYGGTGLGLAISKLLAELMDARVAELAVELRVVLAVAREQPHRAAANVRNQPLAVVRADQQRRRQIVEAILVFSIRRHFSGG